MERGINADGIDNRLWRLTSNDPYPEEDDYDFYNNNVQQINLSTIDVTGSLGLWGVTQK